MIMGLNSLKQTEVAGDQRALADQADRHSALAAQPLQHSLGNSESPLGWLVRIGCRADDDAFESSGFLPIRNAGQIALKSSQDRVTPLYENAVFEGFPIGI